MQAHPIQDQETRTITHAFPTPDFLGEAVRHLQRLYIERHGPHLDHRQFLKRHAPAMPQAPMKPAA